MISCLAAAVVVELFTSEGCSSCPPADALLERLDREGVIALGEHVDYWNDLGWRDSFSSDRFTARQEAYRRAFGARSIYTPQMVVDGARQCVGGDAGAAAEAIAAAARASKARVILSAGGGRARIEVSGAVPALTLDPGWKREALRVVVFVQERRGRRILGAASVTLAP